MLEGPIRCSLKEHFVETWQKVAESLGEEDLFKKWRQHKPLPPPTTTTTPGPVPNNTSPRQLS